MTARQFDNIGNDAVGFSQEPIAESFFKSVDAWIRGGNKTFRVSQEMVDAFSQVELNILPTDYNQPFDDVKVVLPDGTEIFCGMVTVKSTRYDKRDGSILRQTLPCLKLVTRIGTSIGDVNYVLIGEKTFEEKFLVDGMTEEQELRTRQRERIAINAMLVACNHPTRIVPAPHINLNMPRRIVRERQMGRHEYIEFIDQNIRWIDDQRQVNEGPGTPGSVKRPHWRKGHYRRQRVGEGRTGVKLIFIRPVLINEEYFIGGDNQHTTYTAA